MKKLGDFVQQQARAKVRADKKIRDILCTEIDAALIAYIDFIQIENGVLNLSVTSSVWASRLRFFSDTMLLALRQANMQVVRVKTTVISRPNTDELLRQQQPNHKSISATSLEGLNSLSDAMENNELKKSLDKLIQSAKRKNRP